MDMTFWFSLGAILISLASLGVSIWAVVYNRKQYLSPIRPEVYINYIKVDQINQEVVFFIQNRSENIAILLDVKPRTKNIILVQPIARYELTNDTTKAYSVSCRYVGGDINHDTFKLKIKYADKEGNRYKATLFAGKGALYIE